jgi:hypothetical protein
MRLTKDHICEIRSNDEYWFDINRMVFKSELLTMDKASLIDLICVSFEKIYAMDNRKSALSKGIQKRYASVSHNIENDILKVVMSIELFKSESEIPPKAKKTTTKYVTTASVVHRKRKS